MAKPGPVLSLEITTSDGVRSLILKPGESLILGRGGRSGLLLSKKSVSQEHLEIGWDGQEVSVRDLGSSNGTFRMPQDSAFVEARFPVAYPPLELRLSSENVRLVWARADERTVARTAILEGTHAKTAISPMKTHVGASEEEVRQVTRTGVTGLAMDPAAPAAPSEAPAESRAAPANTEPVLPEPERLGGEGEPRSAGWDLRAGARELVWFLWPFVLVAWAWRRELPSFRGLSREDLALGAGKDFTILWWDRSLALAPAALGILAACALVWFLWDRHLAQRIGALRWSLRLLIVLIAWIFPPLSMQGPGFFSFLPHARKIQRIVLSGPGPAALSSEELKAQSQWLRDQREIFAGSGIAYKAVFERQWFRVLRECDGVGEDRKWDRKRVCLVLLAAVSIETFDDFRPRLLFETAERVTLLTVLDGLTRVVQVEGRESDFALFFLNSLRSTGLDAERQDLETILLDKTRPPETLRSLLFDLRRQVDRALVEHQRERGLPLALRLRVPGPLESGI